MPDRQTPSAAHTEIEVDAATYDKLVRIAWMRDCTPAAALEEVIREFKFESEAEVV